jgi:hypothetical protein
MAFTEDLTAFFSTDDFAVSALYNGTTTINVILYTAYYEENMGRVGFEGSAPVALARTADVPGVAHGVSLVIYGVTYSVVGVEPDGTGLTTLRLEKQ